MSIVSVIDQAAEPVTVVFQVFVAAVVVGRIAQFVFAKIGLEQVSGVVDKVLDRLLKRFSH